MNDRVAPMTIPDTSTPVVVLKLYHHLGLGLVRTLGRLGVPVYAIDPNPRAPGVKSRYCRGWFAWDIDGRSDAETIEFLKSVGKRIGRRSILIPTCDEMAQMLPHHFDALREWFIFPAQSATLARTLASKKEMYFLAKEHGIPTAETHFPASREDVVRLLVSVTFPVMFKGIDGMLLQARMGKKMAIVRTADELLALYDRYEDHAHPNIMLQEYIPGGDDTVWMFNGYFNDDSDCLFAVTGKKIRQAPVYTGYTSLGVCLHNELVRKRTVDFMKRLGYRGILDIGYRYDARDGEYKVLDINPRIGATFRLFVARNGMDVARAAYLDLTGQEVPVSDFHEGRKWVVEERDLISSVRYFRAHQLSVGEWIGSFRGVEEAAHFAADDLLPFWLMCWGLIKRPFHGGFRRL